MASWVGVWGDVMVDVYYNTSPAHGLIPRLLDTTLRRKPSANAVDMVVSVTRLCTAVFHQRLFPDQGRFLSFSFGLVLMLTLLSIELWTCPGESVTASTIELLMLESS